MRVRLRRPLAGDADAMHRAMQDRDTIGWLPFLPDPYLYSDAEGFIVCAAGGPDRVIEVDGAFAGMIRTGTDLGYWLARDFRGQGIMRRAAQVALIQHFADSDTPVTASHLDNNDASRRVLLGLGFRDTGPARLPRHDDSRTLPGRALELSADDFFAGLGLRTARCQITPLREDDLPELHRIVTQPQVARMLLRFYPGQSLDEVAALMRPAMDPRQRPMRLAIRQRGRFIGSIGVHSGDAPPVYYFLAPERAGQGLASEIVPVFCDTVQDWYGLDTLQAEVFGDNPASRRVLEKAGFVVTDLRGMPSAGRAESAEGWGMRRGAPTSAEPPRPS